MSNEPIEAFLCGLLMIVGCFISYCAGYRIGTRRREKILPKQIKTQSLLLDIANNIENNPAVPSIDQVESNINDFLDAVDSGSLTKQTVTGNELIASLVKLQVETV